ncbi:MAG: hypothetical protein AB1452_09470 [Pseudomonadota bacterium]
MATYRRSPAQPINQRPVWREQEQKLIESWNAASQRYRAIHEQLSACAAAAGGEIEADLRRQAQAALAEIEALRRKVARLKREFLSGERY